VRHFAHGFKREIVSVDAQGVQGSSQFPVLSSQFVVGGRSLSRVPIAFRIRASL
jgi:hypothetical protein